MTRAVAGMTKQQTGLRVDRILFIQFQELCRKERLRTGEAVETLIRGVVDAGSVIGFSENSRKQRIGSGIEDILFKSRLSRLECILKLQWKFFKATGEQMEYGSPEEMEALEKELAEIARKGIDEKLVVEFEKLLVKIDALDAEVGARETDDRIKDNDDNDNDD